MVKGTVVTCAACILASLSTLGGAQDPGGRAYRFTLTRGASAPVCNAYLRRLNTATYFVPPYCDRPEATAVPDFIPLNRVPLSAQATQDLYPRVHGFMRLKNQGSKQNDDAMREKARRLGIPPDIPTLENIDSALQRHELVAWHYAPKVDIDNDGKADELLLWQGAGISAVQGVCGRRITTASFSNDREPQVAFVQASGEDRLDIAKTIAIFGHPSGGYLLPNGKMANRFRPVGPAIGIFKYRDLYYFDTFFDSWGDFENERTNDPELQNTLGVFLHKDGKTRQVCEYRMTESAH